MTTLKVKVKIYRVTAIKKEAAIFLGIWQGRKPKKWGWMEG
ncbi:hypothetical protein [Cyclobacterium roseum]|nr:hypothetical protein [Cyclobacterium roseum]